TSWSSQPARPTPTHTQDSSPAVLTPAQVPVAPVSLGSGAFLPITGSATDVAAGSAHGCALVSGRVYCWGKNDRWQLGRAPAAHEVWQPPAEVPSPAGADRMGDVVSIAAYGDRTCAVGAKGAVYCWGELA